VLKIGRQAGIDYEREKWKALSYALSKELGSIPRMPVKKAPDSKQAVDRKEANLLRSEYEREGEVAFWPSFGVRNGGGPGDVHASSLKQTKREENRICRQDSSKQIGTMWTKKHCELASEQRKADWSPLRACAHPQGGGARKPAIAVLQKQMKSEE